MKRADTCSNFHHSICISHVFWHRVLHYELFDIWDANWIVILRSGIGLNFTDLKNNTAMALFVRLEEERRKNTALCLALMSLFLE